MQRYIHRLAALITALFSTLSIFAYDFEVDGICYNVVSLQDLTAEIAKPTNYKYSGDFVIPSSVTYSNRQFSVVGIGEFAFNKRITSIIIPNSVIYIGRYAFSGCSSLSKIDIPNSVTDIIQGAFSGCSSLREIDIPNSVTDIGSHTFSNCSSLSKIDIPNSVTDIGEHTFENCSILSDVKLSDKLKIINFNIFEGCNNLSSITIPGLVEEITGIEFIKLPLKELVFLEGPDPITFNSVIRYIPIERLIIGRNVDFKYDYYKLKTPFRFFDNLKEIEVKDNVTDIRCLNKDGGNDYWRYEIISSSTLEKIKFGSGLTSLLKLSKCENLKTIILTSTTPQDISAFTNAQYMNVNVIVPKGSLGSYMQHDIWKNFWNITEGDVTSGIDDVVVSENEISVKTVNIHQVGSAIIIENAENIPVSVYSIVGTTMYHTMSYQGEQIDLSPGIYIVKCDNKTLKIKI